MFKVLFAIYLSELARIEQQVEDDYALALRIVYDQDNPVSQVSLQRSMQSHRVGNIAAGFTGIAHSC